MINAAETTVTGFPALLIIILVLALIVLGIISVIRLVGRRAKEK